MTIKIKVELTIKDKTVELTFDEAKALYFQLKPICENVAQKTMQDLIDEYKRNSPWISRKSILPPYVLRYIAGDQVQ